MKLFLELIDGRGRFLLKAFCCSVGVGVIPLMAVAILAGLQGQVLERQIHEAKFESPLEARKLHALLNQQRQVLVMVTGGMIVVAGGMAIFATSRSVRPILSAVKVTGRLVRQLREKAPTEGLESLPDDVVLMRNINLIGLRMLKLRSQLAITANSSSPSPLLPLYANITQNDQWLANMLEQLQTSDLITQDLSEATFKQTQVIDHIYTQINQWQATTDSLIPDLKDITPQDPPLPHLTQACQQDIQKIEEHYTSLWGTVVAASAQIQPLNQIIPKLENALTIIHTLATTLKHQAMAMALEAARQGKTGLPLIAISEQMHTLTQKLERNTAQLPSIAATLRTETSTLATQLNHEQHKANAGKQLLTSMKQHLDPIDRKAQTLHQLSEQIVAQLAQQQQQSQDTRQTVIEVATLSSQISSQAALLNRTFDHLAHLVQQTEVYSDRSIG